MSLARGIRHPCHLRHPCRSLRIRHPCRLQHPCRMLPCLLCQQGLLSQWPAQPQPQPQPPISSSGLPIKVGDDVEIIAGRSASAKRARPEDQVTDKAKRARSASTSRRSPSPQRHYPEDQSEGEIVDSEGDPADAGIPMLDSLKMTEEEQRDYDAFSLASVSVPKPPWRAQEDSNVSKPQPQNISLTRQARPVTSRAVAKAQSVKSAQFDQRSVQFRSSVQDQPMNGAQFQVLASQGQGQRQGLGRPVVVQRDDIDSLFNEEEFSIDVDNEAVLREKQARSEALDRVAEFCNLDRQDPQIQKEVMGMRLPAYNAPAKKSIEISLPWHSSTIPIADMNHDIVRGKLNKSLKPQNPAKPWSPKDFFGGSGYYTHNTRGYLAKPESRVVPSRPPPAERTAEDQPFFHVPRNPEDPRT